MKTFWCLKRGFVYLGGFAMNVWLHRDRAWLLTVIMSVSLMEMHSLEAAPVLSARYDPADGNITLVAIDDITSQPVALSIATF